MGDTSVAAVCARVKAFRLAKGIKSQREMARRLDIEHTRYHNWENGRIIPIEYAVKLCYLFGATLDYIYRGEVSGLPLQLAQQLRTVEAEQAEHPAQETGT